MTFFKSMTFKIAFVALTTGLTFGTTACSKKTFTSVPTENIDQGTNANANGGNANGAATNTTTNNTTTNNNTGNNNGNTTSVTTNTNTGNNNGTGNGTTTSADTTTNNGTTTNSNNGTTNGTTTSANTNTTNGTTTTTNNNGSNNNGNTTGPQPNPQYCLTEKYTQPKATVIKKLDVLIVTDSSASMDTERAALANGIGDFIGQLPADTDVRFAVMLAHGETSWFSGRLYKSDFKDPREKYVLSNKNMDVPTLKKWMNRKLRYRIKESYKYQVRGFTDNSDFTKFDSSIVELGLPQDYDASGGEAGIFSLHRAFKVWDPDSACPSGGPCRYTAIQNLSKDPSLTAELDFFRNDAALSVIFISDENDLCYPQRSHGRDDAINEAPFYNAYCKNWPNPAETTLQRIQILRQSLPLYLSSIIYNSAGFPAGSPGLENGYGDGYNKMATIANGTIIDMKNGSSVIAPGLANIGGHATNMMNLRHDFILKYKHVDASTIAAKAEDVPGSNVFTSKTHTYSSTTNTVYIADSGTAQSKVHIKYCLVKDAALDPYEIQISSFLLKAAPSTYKPDVVVETK